jgi:hypothetical protein
MEMPYGWKATYERTAEDRFGLEVSIEGEVGDESVCVRWTEGCDDHFGTTSRTCAFPVAVIEALRGGAS